MFGPFKHKPAEPQTPDIRYSHPGVEEFNRRLLERQNPPPPSRIELPWSPAKKTPLPHVHWDFDMSRDPLIRRQLLDAANTERKRRDDQSGRGSAMVKLDKPFMAHRPPPHQRGGVDRSKFANDWLKEQRDALKALTPPDKIPRDPGFDRTLTPRRPSR